MSTTALETVLERLRRSFLRQDEAGLADAELVDRFLLERDGASFEALVRRHGPMVLGVCRRVLRNEAEAEDAFQATFLVLVKKAASIRQRALVGNWLYGVAHSTALKARAMNSKRSAREREAATRLAPADNGDAAKHLQGLLDQELQHLPDKYRAAIVLCELEGKTISEAARQLGCPPGTIGTRLARGRKLLARRLVRRGMSLSVGAVASLLAANASASGVPPALMGSTVKAAALLAAGRAIGSGIVSTQVAALTHGVLQSMLLSKLKLTSAALLVAAALGGGVGSWSIGILAATESGPPPVIASAGSVQSQRKELDAAATDNERLQGVWTPIASFVDGEKKDPSDAKLQQWKLVFQGDKVTIPDNRTVFYLLEPNKKPKLMDLLGKTGDPEILAIYELEKDKLRVSFKKTNGHPTEADRPTDFDTAKNQSVLIILKRREGS